MSCEMCPECRKQAGLSVKTVDRGCTEAEAAAAREKLAELRAKHDPATCAAGGAGTSDDWAAWWEDFRRRHGIQEPTIDAWFDASHRRFEEDMRRWEAEKAKREEERKAADARRETEEKAARERREAERKAEDAAWIESLDRDAPPSKWAFPRGVWDFEAEIGIAHEAEDGPPPGYDPDFSWEDATPEPPAVPTAAPTPGGKPPAEPPAETPATAMPTFDPGEVPGVEQIHEWLAAFAQDYPAVEIRVIGATGRSGVFGERFTDLGRAAAYAARWSGESKGVYFTLNPLKGPKIKGKAATDEDVLRRQWLFIDADPERGEHKNDSATVEEKARAWEALCKVRDRLRARGWPEPIVCDSGNGWHLYYRIDLPNDDADTLVKRVLEALDRRFSTAAVNIDPVNSNAGRITKCFGTLARKGDDTPDRPHRYARVLSVPDVLEVVLREMLEDLAGEPPPIPLDLDAEIARKRARHAPAEARRAARDGTARDGADRGIGVSVADDYGSRDPWPGIMEAVEWAHVRTYADGTERWLRPGGSGGSSGTIGWNGQNLLYVFSSGAAPFKENTAYSPFDAYATVFHDGDAAAAAKDLYQKGYGTHFEWVWDAGDGPLIEMEHPASERGLVWATGTGAGEWVMKEFQNPHAKGHERATPKNKPDGPPRRKGHAARPSRNGTGHAAERKMTAGPSGASAPTAPSTPSVNGMAAHSANGQADGQRHETAPGTTADPTDTGPPPTVEELLRRAGEFTLLSQVLADTEFLEGLARREVGDEAGARRVLLALREGLGKKFAVKPFKAAMERYRRAARAAAGGDARPEADEAIEADSDPHRLARVVAAIYQGHLARFRGDYMRYRGTHWEADPDFVGETLVVEVKEEVDRCAAEALDRWKHAMATKNAIEAKGGIYDGDIGPKPKAIRVTRALIADVDQALGSMVTTGCRDEPPFWLDRRPGDPDPTKIVAVRNRLLDLSGLAPVLRPHDRRFFSPLCLPFDYDPKAPPPPLWHSLLHEQWGGDMETLEAIDEMIGYLLLPNTSQQKIFLLLGPPRSGRGTMIRVITELLGRENIIDTTPASLADPFGLQGFLGKTVAIMADARTQDSETLAVVMNRLLSISGEDRIPVNQKNRPILSVKLNTRILLVSNEVPTFRDQSGAIVARHIIINADHEVPPERRDPDLDKKIIANELPGILNLAIEGLYRLRDRGRFRQPDSAAHLVDNARDIASPIRSYVGQRCILAPGSAVEKARLFNDWCSWCEPRKYQPGNEAIFLKNLYAACPTVRAVRSRAGEDRIQVLKGIELREPS